MTRVDFHFNVPDKLGYGCRLVRKICQAGHRAVVYCDDPERLSRFDQALWTFAPLSFIPHTMADDRLAARTPVVLTDRVCDLPHHEVLVNLGSDTPEFFSRFDRLLELVASDDGDRSLGRNRYRFYKDRGYPLTTHEAER
jgi:DNA polymerase-3 subunit chi